MVDDKKFTLVNGKIRLDKCGGKIVLSPKPKKESDDEETDCCCGCDDANFSEIKLEYSACHGCELAIFSAWISFNNTDSTEDWTRIGRLNLNSSRATADCSGGVDTIAQPIFVRESLIKRVVDSRLPESEKNCCDLYVRLKCEIGSAASSNSFADNWDCHSGAAALKVTRTRDERVLYDGTCGTRPIAVNVCPEDESIITIPI